MRRTTRVGRFSDCSSSPPPSSSKSLAAPEVLEERRLLAGDLLVSLFDTTDGMSVLRYDGTNQLIAGGVATGSGGVGQTQSLAVAPDGSFFVSNLGGSNVLHFDADGSFLGVLGQNDTTSAGIIVPGALQFGPNGNLYVADIVTGYIHQFDITNPTQQYIVGSTLQPGFGTGGFTWDANGDIIVGSLLQESVTRFDSQGNGTVLIEPFSNIVPAVILVRPDGDLLIADIDFGGEPLQHHQIVLYDMSEDMTSTFIDLTFPVGTGDAAGNPPQPLSMIYDEDGELLIGVSPDHNFNGAVLKYDSTTGEYLDTLISGIGTPSGLRRVPLSETSIVGRHLFYNQSKYDNNTAGVSASDDNAIATDKMPYFAGDGVAMPNNVSAYVHGINGLMVDIENAAGTLTASDFTFKTGDNNSPDTWTTVAVTPTVSVRPGAGVGGSDRVEIIFPNGAIKNTWLQVTVEGNDDAGGFNTNTGLASSDVFYFGSRLGDTLISPPATVFTTNASDEIGARDHIGFNQPLTNIYDFNKDGLVGATDQIVARNNVGFLTRINIPSNPSPQVASATPDAGHNAVASALAAADVPQAAAGGSGPVVALTASDVTREIRRQVFAQLVVERLSGLATIEVDGDEPGEEESLLDALLAR